MELIRTVKAYERLKFGRLGLLLRFSIQRRVGADNCSLLSCSSLFIGGFFRCLAVILWQEHAMYFWANLQEVSQRK